MNPLFKDLIIFEMANNHQGSVEHGIKIVDEFAKIKDKYDLNASVKFQYRSIPGVVHPDYRESDHKLIRRFLDTAMEKEKFRILNERAKECGLITMCTPFDEESVDICVEHGVQLLKVASCNALDWHINQRICETKLPVVVSTGGLRVAEIDKLYNFFTHRECDFSLLYCVSIYPTPDTHFNLNFIERMIARYPDIPIGYSGHESPENHLVSQMAIAKGAKILERHIGIGTEDNPLNGYSLSPEQAEEWVRAILYAKRICGGQDAYQERSVSPEERAALDALKRGVYAASTIKKGDILSRDKVFFAMPWSENQLSSGEFVAGTIATHDYQVGEPVHEVTDSGIKRFRSVVHEVKGFLCENRIPLAQDVEFELYHHYGSESFREWGAVMVNIVNRAYCKRLIILLSNQKYPTHYHAKKEESFHVLVGELDLTVDGEQRILRTGEIATVLPGVPHSFSGRTGVILEELSTTYIKNDSYYTDSTISDKDPILRKTILHSW